MFSETIFSINCTFKTIIDLRFPRWFSEFIIFDLQVINRVIYYFVSRSETVSRFLFMADFHWPTRGTFLTIKSINKI